MFNGGACVLARAIAFCEVVARRTTTPAHGASAAAHCACDRQFHHSFAATDNPVNDAVHHSPEVAMAKLLQIIAGLIVAIAIAWPAPASAQLREAAALDAKVTALYSAGKYQEAIPLAQRSLAIREKALGPDNLNIANSIYNLAMLHDYQGNYADAEMLFRRALAIYEKARGPDHPDVADAVDNIATLYKEQGRYADAEPLFQRSLAIREKALGPGHPDVANSLSNLADLYGDLARFADAEQLYKRSLAIRDKARASRRFTAIDAKNYAMGLNNLANLYRFEGRNTDAEPLYKQSLAIREKTLGPDHPDVASRWETLLTFTAKRAATKRPSRSTNGLWQSTERRSGPTIARSAAR